MHRLAAAAGVMLAIQAYRNSMWIFLTWITPSDRVDPDAHALGSIG